MRTWIKFCGTTSLGDAMASIEAGADALGFIFAPSKRQITPDKAQEICSSISPDIERVGVFVNEEPDNILRIVRQCGLTAVQLHGEESPSCVFSFHDRIAVIKTIQVNEGFTSRLDELSGRREAPDFFLLDSGAGSGHSFDWGMARARLGGRKSRFIVAGGLTPHNVRDAIQIFLPFGVDVVSGVESEPGKKDVEKLKAFVTAVRNAEKEAWAAQH